MPAARHFLFAFIIALVSAGIWFMAGYLWDLSVWLGGAYARWRKRRIDRWHREMESGYNKRR